MRIKEELRTFTDGAQELALKMIVLVDEINLGTKSHVQGAVEMDEMAREQIANMQTIKDLAYRLGRGEDRVSTVQVNESEQEKNTRIALNINPYQEGK